MKKRLLSLLLSFLLVITSVIAPAFAEDTAEVDEEALKLHYHTGAPVTAIPEELFEVDSRGGERIPLDSYNFSSPDAKFNLSGLGMIWTQVGNQGFYKLTIEDEYPGKHCLSEPFPVKANRQYLLSVLVWSDFSRWYTTLERTREVTISLSINNNDSTKQFISLRKGLPDNTKGWKRLEFLVSPGLLEAGSMAQLDLYTTGFTNGAPESSIYIADYRAYELPAKELVPYKEGEGVTFRGGAGALDMRVENAVEEDSSIIVDTTGARYTFDTETDTITAEQKISKKRKVSTWKSEVSLKGLKVRSLTENEAVITNPNITFGVQLDGTLFLTPHNGDARLVCTSEIAGIWNRFAFGYLLALDDYGGFTVTPDIPVGTGKTCSYEILTEGLDFPTWEFSNGIVATSNTYEEELNTMISNAKPGWQIAYTVSPGERLAITTFPPREYDWEASFTDSYMNVYSGALHLTKMEERAEKQGIGTVAMWGIEHQAAGMGFGRHYIYDIYEGNMIDLIKTAHEEGVKAIAYTSAFFYYNKQEPTEYINEVKRIRDTYGIDGVYSDGFPSESEWVTGYEEVRMLRELFPDGSLIAHMTGQPGNGGPPLSAASFFLPMVDCYLSHSLKGENIGIIGYEKPLGYVTWNNYNIGNCIGVPKGDYWQVPDENGEMIRIPQNTLDLLNLIQNGRARQIDENFWNTVYYPMLQRLYQEWQEHGDEENFYEKYFAPLAREMCHEHLEYIGDIDALSSDFEEENPLRLYNVTNVKAEAKDGAIKVTGNRNHDEGSIFKKTMSLSGDITVEYDVKIHEAGDYEQLIGDDYGTPGIGIMFSKDGKIKLKTSDGGYSIIGKYGRNTVQKVRLEINTDAHKFDVFVNDKQLITDMNLDNELYYIGSYEFMSGGYGSAFTLDNFNVSYRY